MLCLIGTTAAAAAELRGTVQIQSGRAMLRASESADAVVYFRPRTPPPVTAAPDPAVMLTRRKEFVPRVLAITAGSTVRFPNEDPILHNAFSTSTNNAFDTGVYGAGEGAEHTFASPGLVKVYCNVHHSMVGHILVLDTPYFARPDAEGNFVLRDLPSEEGDLVVFHDRTDPWRQSVVPGGEPVAVTLQVIRRKVPAHMNKFGKPYGSSTPGKY